MSVPTAMPTAAHTQAGSTLLWRIDPARPSTTASPSGPIEAFRDQRLLAGIAVSSETSLGGRQTLARDPLELVGGFVMTRSSILEELVNLGPSGVPLAEALSCPATYAPLLGIPAQAVIATVQRIEPPRPVEPLVWAVAEGRTILFRVDDATFREMQAALAAGERPTAIVEPCQIVSIDL